MNLQDLYIISTKNCKPLYYYNIKDHKLTFKITRDLYNKPFRDWLYFISSGKTDIWNGEYYEILRIDQRASTYVSIKDLVEVS